ncbi:unnamed protein product [Ostreobium quekettii]|uniref:Bestrophin homolog n=1 Tax=Ostreobium quekettii TaxID=121088 RepID=A0A8S1IXI1_9CHLO|nr:unnamed protein product [Ostreobium quekettii]|eukprot:evm.model.scf_1964.1 EVM.evm.TU.scf_1964.1   scf_1964:15406-20322(+)
MILYSKAFWGYQELLRFYGSAIPRSLPAAFLSAVVTLLFELLSGDQEEMKLWFGKIKPFPYPFQVFAFVVGFMLVFRATFSYRRYWEARTELQNMTAFYTSVVMETLNFDMGSLPEGASPQQVQKAITFGETFIHYMSLLHAVGVQSLRKDWDFSNMVNHDIQEDPLPYDASKILAKHIRQTVGQPECDDDKCALPSWWWPFTTFIKRCQIHFQFADFVFLRSSRRVRLEYNSRMKLPVVGGISEDEAVALGSRVGYVSKTGESRGGVLSNGIVVPGPGERVSVVAAWVNQILQDRRREGGLRVHPAIMSRVFASLSNGLQGYEQARKLVDTPFPFPWSQFVTAVLLVFAVTLPLVTAAFIRNTPLAVVIAFISTWAHYALNEVSQDLEDPFIYEPNDLPMVQQQWIFNEKILALARTKRPISNFELGMTTGPTFRKMASRLRTASDVVKASESGGLSRVGGPSKVREEVLNYGLTASSELPVSIGRDPGHSGGNEGLVLDDIYTETRPGGTGAADGAQENSGDGPVDPPHT